MQSNGITFEDVVMAANHIRSQGENPTIEKVRLYLGSGSNTTINKYLKTWKAQQQIVGEDQTTEWSSDIVKMAAEQAWVSIRKEAENKITAIKEEADKAIHNAKEEVLEAVQAKEHAQKELSEVSEQFISLQAKYELLFLDFKALQQDHALLIERNKGLIQQFEMTKTQSERYINDQNRNHEAELKRLLELQDGMKAQFDQHLHEVRHQCEEMRHQFMRDLDQNQEQNKKLNKEKNILMEQLKNKEQELVEAKTLLSTYAIEREENLNLINSLPTQIERLSNSLEKQQSLQTERAQLFEERVSAMQIHTNNALQTIAIKIEKLKMKTKVKKVKNKTEEIA